MTQKHNDAEKNNVYHFKFECPSCKAELSKRTLPKQHWIMECSECHSYWRILKVSNPEIRHYGTDKMDSITVDVEKVSKEEVKRGFKKVHN